MRSNVLPAKGRRLPIVVFLAAVAAMLGWLLSAEGVYGQTGHEVHAVRGRAKAGSRVAWLAVGRERVLEHLESRGSVGMATAGGDGSVDIVPPVTGARFAISLIDLDEGVATRVVPESEPSAGERLSIEVVTGASSIFVDAGEIHLVFARKRGHAWTYRAHDGGSLDADGASNGRIQVPLQALQSVQGEIPPPSSVEAGDVVIALEPRTLRSAEVVVP